MAPDGPPEAPSSERATGPIAWMARTPVAANLLMVIILTGGLVSAMQVKQEVFPEFTIDVVRVTVPYPGASPDEVEQGIVLVVEEAIRAVDGVKRVSSVASENSGTIAAELLISADGDKVLNDIKGEVDRITSFPQLAEKPMVKLVSRKRQVISLVLAGRKDMKTLHALAERARAEILNSSSVTQVDIEGVPPVEVGIELSRERLEQYGLSSAEVARAVAMSSLDLPGGEIETAGGEILVRVADRKLNGVDFGEIVLKASPQGADVRLRDVAEINDSYADIDTETSFNRKNAVRLTAYRVGDETPILVADVVKDYAKVLAKELEGEVEVATWNDQSEMLRARIDLLVRNARLGLILVILILALFLDLRLAFWVSMGIPISFMGAFLLTPWLGMSVNMVTLFAFIVTLGMVVDDAIIVGEHAFKKIQDGMTPLGGAIEGARQMAVPVTFAVLTTTAAFAPLYFVPGVMGKIFRLIPLVVIAVLLFSVIESFFVLPAHVAHIKIGKPLPRFFQIVLWPVLWANRHTSQGLLWATDKFYRPLLRFCLSWRYATFAGAVGALIISFGLVASGVAPFSFFPELEGDQVKAQIRLPYGAAESLGRNALERLEEGAVATIDEYGGMDVVRGMYARLGEGTPVGGPGGGALEKGSHIVSMEVSLIPGEERTFSAAAFAQSWRKNVGTVVGARSAVFDAATGPGAGAAVDVQLSHTDSKVLGRASRDLAEELRTFKELVNIENTYASGKPQIDFKLKPEAVALGLTPNALAVQLRSSFFGAEAIREQRGRDEMKVMVRLGADQRQSEHDIEELRVQTPSGGMVPLAYVAELERGRAPTTINREDGRRTVNVLAKLAPTAPSPRPILEDLQKGKLPQLLESYPGLAWKFVGSQRARREALGSLLINALFAFLIIYALLAIPFKSYAQPIIVMSAIPFGFVGAILGHVVMGFEISIISVMGIVALSGVVVNDSLVLIDATNRARAEGMSPIEAITYGGSRRVRPIVLTSLTTFFGLVPMIFEQSLQARFLIPMAISLGFGVLFATLVALLVVPSIYMIIDDFGRLWRWTWSPLSKRS